MGVRLLLAAGVESRTLFPLVGMLEKPTRRSRGDRLESAVGGEPQADRTAATIVGREDDLPGGIDGDVARARAAGRL